MGMNAESSREATAMPMKESRLAIILWGRSLGSRLYVYGAQFGHQVINKTPGFER